MISRAENLDGSVTWLRDLTLNSAYYAIHDAKPTTTGTTTATITTTPKLFLQQQQQLTPQPKLLQSPPPCVVSSQTSTLSPKSFTCHYSPGYLQTSLPKTFTATPLLDTPIIYDCPSQTQINSPPLGFPHLLIYSTYSIPTQSCL